jgi:hypothetical protein
MTNPGLKDAMMTSLQPTWPQMSTYTKKIVSQSVDAVSTKAHSLSIISKVVYIHFDIPSILSLSSLDGCRLNIKLEEQTFQAI